MSDIEVEQHNRETKEKSTTVFSKDTERINRARDPQHSSKSRDRSIERHNQNVREQTEHERSHNAEVDEHIRPKKSFVTKVKEKYSKLSKYIPHKDPKPKVASSGKKPKKSKKGAHTSKSYKGARSSNLFGAMPAIGDYSAHDPFEGESHVRGEMRYHPPELHMGNHIPSPNMGFKPKKRRP